MLTRTTAALLTWATAQAALPRLELHNPHGASLRQLHVVHSAHFDGGCKTFGCSARLLEGEPDRCAQRHAEPYAYHIVNRWFDEYFPRVVAYANRTRGDPVRYRHLTQPWLLSLLFACNDSSTGGAAWRSWPGSGWAVEGMPLLHCPNASVVAQVEGALKRGDITYHAFPHDAQASAFTDATLFDAALALPRRLSARLGLPMPSAVSVRDVPGWTRATIPLLARRNITGLSFGAGTPPGKPDVPPLFVWRDEATATEVVVTYESKYGDTSTVFVLPNGVGLVADWKGDNTGPAPVGAVVNDTLLLQKRFPHAEVIVSTLDAFFAAANVPAVKSQLPVVTREIGDGWLYGIPSDPLKQALFREAGRQRVACLESGDCSPDSPGMQAFERMLVKVPEHTAGVASQVFMGDYLNWSNAQFDVARENGVAQGFYNGSLKRGDYNTTVNSWIEQRHFITDTPQMLTNTEPKLANSLKTAFERLRNVVLPTTAGLEAVASPNETVFRCGQLRLGIDQRGAVTMLQSGTAKEKSTNWASDEHPLGLYQYHTFDNEDYNAFLQDFTVRVNGSAYRACPAHYVEGSEDDLDCRNFRKPNVSSAQPQHRELTPTLMKLWRGTVADGGCTILSELVMDPAAHAAAGAPAKIIINLTVTDDSRLSWQVFQIKKRATRLPEAGFFSFVPKPASAVPAGWRLHVLGSAMDPADVIGSQGTDRNDSTYGGSPHLRGVETVSWSSAMDSDARRTVEGGLRLSSLDVPILSAGEATPFPTPRTAAPDMTKGVHFNIFNNIWNTNYVLWYPFEQSDETILSRFELVLHPKSSKI